MKKNDPLGDRIKQYEGPLSKLKLMAGVPSIFRLDGVNFSKWTNGLKRPFDERLSTIMVKVAQDLVTKYNAKLAYTQSDEITLVIFNEVGTYPQFGNRVCKLVGSMAVHASLQFNKYVKELLPSKADQPAEFDCRPFIVPSKTEAVNTVLWREFDATKNSISMAAQNQFSHKSLQGLTCKDMQEKLLTTANINWNDYPTFFKRGTYVQRKRIYTELTPEEIETLPPKHNARKEGSAWFQRNKTTVIDMPPLVKVINRNDVFFEGEEPITDAQAKGEEESWPNQIKDYLN